MNSTRVLITKLDSLPSDPPNTIREAYTLTCAGSYKDEALLIGVNLKYINTQHFDEPSFIQYWKRDDEKGIKHPRISCLEVEIIGNSQIVAYKYAFPPASVRVAAKAIRILRKL